MGMAGARGGAEDEASCLLSLPPPIVLSEERELVAHRGGIDDDDDDDDDLQYISFRGEVSQASPARPGGWRAEPYLSPALLEVPTCDERWEDLNQGLTREEIASALGNIDPRAALE